MAGGQVTSRQGGELSSVEVMVVGQPYWQVKQALPQPRVAPSLVVTNNIVQLSGGSYETDNRRTEVFPDTVLEYDAVEDQWRPVARVMGRAHHQAIAVRKSSFTSC